MRLKKVNQVKLMTVVSQVYVLSLNITMTCSNVFLDHLLSVQHNSHAVPLHLIFEKSSLKNPVRRTGFLVYFELDFYSCVACKKVRNGLKIQFIELDFSNSIFQKSSAEGQGDQYKTRMKILKNQTRNLISCLPNSFTNRYPIPNSEFSRIIYVRIQSIESKLCNVVFEVVHDYLCK